MNDAIRDFWDRQPCDSIFGDDWKLIRQRRYFIVPYIPEWAGFGRWAGKRILEIGCGIGTDAISFAEQGAHVTACDLSPVSVAQARSHAEAAGVSSQIDFLVADAQRLREYLEPQPFDLIYSCGVLHHMPEPERVLDQIKRHYTKPSSVLKMLVYYRYSWVPLALLLRRGKGAFWRLEQIVAEHSEQQSGGPLTRIYSRRGVRKLLKGFRVTETIVRWIYPYRDLEGKRKTWYFRWIPNNVLKQLEPFIGWHLCVTANLANGYDSISPPQSDR